VEVVYVHHAELEVLEVVQTLQKDLDPHQVFNLLNQVIQEHLVLVTVVVLTVLVMEQDYQLVVVELVQLEEIHQGLIPLVLEELEDLMI
tara:strand:+ start:160 stop:426 length:267 start_codon:yes stop_codon:yes gene_type:complete